MRLNTGQLRDKICATLFDSQRILETLFISRYDYAKIRLEVKKGPYQVFNELLNKFVFEVDGRTHSNTLFTNLMPAFARY